MTLLEMSYTATTHEKPDHGRSGVSGHDLVRLWNRYLVIRDQPGEPGKGRPRDGGQSEVHRRAARLRNRLLVNYSPLVKYVAGRIQARVSSAADREDVFSWGVVGLLDAIETYDPDRPGRKAKFESYAISKIRWAILDELRRQDWLPRRVRSRARDVERAKIKLAQDLRRRPTETEVADEVDMEVAEYHAFLGEYSRAHVASLEARLEADGSSGIELGLLVGDPSAINPQDWANLQDLRAQLTDAIGRLEERERLITTFYFYEGLTLREVSKALKLSEGRVSQILKGALSRLRDHLQDEAQEEREVARLVAKTGLPVHGSAGVAVLPSRRR